jgi:MFS family permease
MCEADSKAALLGSLFAFGMSATSLWLPTLADKLGRKKIFVLSRFIDCLLYALLLISSSYTVSIICLFGLGATTPGRLNVGVPYMNEWFPKKK